MRLGVNESGLGRGLVVLVPQQSGPLPFQHVWTSPSRHKRLLADAQRLRGKIYVQDGAIPSSYLMPDGRHVQPEDDQSWHLLTVGRGGKVNACIRYSPRRPGVSYSDLAISQAAEHQRNGLKGPVKRAVQAELEKADELGYSFVELGGWVVGEELRCSTEAIRMLIMMYALSQMLGGAIALSTATTRHNSSSILRRTGGSSLMDGEMEIPSYFDPNYNCEMEMLCFDSRFPNPRYAGWIREFRNLLNHLPMISPAPAEVAVPWGAETQNVWEPSLQEAVGV